MNEFARSVGKPIGIALGVLTVVGVAWFLFGDKLKRLVTVKLNPTSDENVIYQDIIGGAGRALSGEQSWALGSAIYDWFHEDANLAGNPKPKSAPDELAWYEQWRRRA